MKKSITLLAVVAFAAVLAIHSPPAVAENQYEITWSTIDAGSTTGTGGPYELNGIIGQPDTGVSSAAEYTLSSGFWPGNFGCVVNLTDLLVLAQAWLDEQDNMPADIDGDGFVDMEDFARLAHWWYDVCPADWPVK